MISSDSDAAHRLYFLDWLRIGAFALLVPYHVGMYYVRWDFHVKSPFAGPALEPWMMLSSPWRLGLLFMISGAATSLMLKRGATVGFLGRRSLRLLLPLLCGMALIVPPQSYFEVRQKYGYAGSYLDFLGLYFTRYAGFCEHGHCLILPTWNHLWFLPYLWLYTLLLWLLLKAAPNALEAMALLAPKLMAGPLLMLLPIAAIDAIRLTLAARYPSTHALAGDWFNHAMYFGLFMTGAVFARWPAAWDRLAGWRWPALALALACWATLVAHRQDSLDAIARQSLIAALQWSALMAAFGFGRRHLDVDLPWRQRLTEGVFPVYLLHQTVIIVLSQMLLPLHWRPALEGPALVAATYLLSCTGCELVRRVAVLRPWFGLAAPALTSPSPSESPASCPPGAPPRHWRVPPTG